MGCRRETECFCVLKKAARERQQCSRWFENLLNPFHLYGLMAFIQSALYTRPVEGNAETIKLIGVAYYGKHRIFICCVAGLVLWYKLKKPEQSE